MLGNSDPVVRERLEGRYYSRMAILHVDCFYLGICEPAEDVERRIRETDAYIRDARGLAS